MNDLIERHAAIDILDAYQVMVENGDENPYAWARLRMSELPSAQPDMAENLNLYKCYITDKDGLQHEVVHTDDIRRVTGWEM